MTGSPLKPARPPTRGPDANDGASTPSCDLDARADADDFSLDEVRSRLHGQLDIRPVAPEPRRVPPPPGPGAHHPLPAWFTSSRPTEVDHGPPTTTGPKVAAATSSNDSEGHHSEDDLVSRPTPSVCLASSASPSHLSLCFFRDTPATIPTPRWCPTCGPA